MNLTLRKIIPFIALILFFSTRAQDKPANDLWHLLPNSASGNSGIGLEEAKEMMKDKTPKTVVVAIADAGVDIYHPDLKNMLWTNQGEIADNGIDDDNNGYIDDVYGWNFCGDVTYDNMELTREYTRLNPKYELIDPSKITDQKEYAYYLRLKEEFLKERQSAKQTFEFLEVLMEGMESVNKKFGQKVTAAEIEAYKPTDKSGQFAKLMLASMAKEQGSVDLDETMEEFQEGFDQYDYMYNKGYNPSFDPRQEQVGDNYDNVNETGYGNSKVYYGEDHSSHGTHVAGIVAADGSNDFGAEGICQSCEIMSIRNVPDGDERDKDVANAIRYAVDNGAKIVNMSFGKGYSYSPEAVLAAIAYAQEKGVLLVHAAGNSSQNNDKSNNFPNDNNDQYSNWLEVGASNWQKKPGALAEFSNYGKAEVDVFAPGVDIYSTTPEDQYEAFNGTSMASPVVAGVAAFIWSYYPTLTAAQVRQVIIDSAIPIKGRNTIPGEKRKKKNVKKLSRTGGLVNLPAALRLAEQITTQN